MLFKQRSITCFISLQRSVYTCCRRRRNSREGGFDAIRWKIARTKGWRASADIFWFQLQRWRNPRVLGQGTGIGPGICNPAQTARPSGTPVHIADRLVTSQQTHLPVLPIQVPTPGTYLFCCSLLATIMVAISVYCKRHFKALLTRFWVF